MNDDLEKRIRERAYEIWENEGRPAGRSDEHWAQACAEFAEARSETENARSETGAAPEKPSLPPRSGKPRAGKTSGDSEPVALAKAAKVRKSRTDTPPASDPDSVGEALQAKEFANSVSVNTTPARAKATVKKGAAARGKRTK